MSAFLNRWQHDIFATKLMFSCLFVFFSWSVPSSSVLKYTQVPPEAELGEISHHQADPIFKPLAGYHSIVMVQ